MISSPNTFVSLGFHSIPPTSFSVVWPETARDAIYSSFCSLFHYKIPTYSTTHAILTVISRSSTAAISLPVSRNVKPTSVAFHTLRKPAQESPPRVINFRRPSPIGRRRRVISYSPVCYEPPILSKESPISN